MRTLYGNDLFDGFDVCQMFPFENAARQRVNAIAIFYIDSPLKDDAPGVEVFIDKMYCTPGDLYTVLERLLLGVEAGK